MSARASRFAGCAALALTLGAGIAQAQVSETSTLWREWTVLDRQLRDARDEAARARKAAAERRARRAPRTPRPAAPPSE